MTGEMNFSIQDALALLGRGENESALAIAEAILAAQPTDVAAMFVVGQVAARMEELGVAIRVLDEAHKLAPENREVVVLLAFFSAFAGRLKDSLYYSKLAVTSTSDPMLAPYLPADFADVSQAIQNVNIPNYVIQATIAMHLREWPKAERLCRRELSLNPDNAAGWRVLAQVHAGQGNLAAAAAAARSAIDLAPSAVESRVLLGELLARDGRYYEALECLRAARALEGPGGSASVQMLACLERFPDEFSALRDAELAAFAAALPARLERGRTGSGRLRVGYLVNEHAADAYERILGPLWAAHSDAVEVYVFQQFMSSDLPLGRRRGDVAHWREVRGLDDETLAYVIRGEGVDVLIDLCGVTPHNRLATLAAGPAPVVLGWLAPGTAEMGVYDAVLSDEWTRPDGPVRAVALPGGSLSMDLGVIAAGLTRDGLAIPAARNGHLTFGARLDVGDVVPAMRHWAAVLAAFPGSVLYLGAVPAISRDMVERLLELAGQFGCAGRLRFQQDAEAVLPEETFWSSIDILLVPPHAHNPALVTDALAVGVPVVTWRSNRHASAIAASLLGQVGRSEWCAADPAELPAIIAKLAPDAAALAAARSALAAAAASSRLFNVPAFALALEEALRALAAEQ